MSQDHVIMPPPNYLPPPSIPLTAPVTGVFPQLQPPIRPDLLQQYDDSENFPEKPQIEMNPPNKTIYINNLEERVALPDMKVTLTNEFSQFGKILDIVLKRNIKMRGQAFIVFQELSSAEQAVKEKQGQYLYYKQMRINFAKQKSDIISKMEGLPIERNRNNRSLEDFVKKPDKKVKLEQDGQTSSSKVQQTFPRPVQKPTVIVPNNILFIENLPAIISEEYLTELFKPYPGFKEVRLISNKFVAFAEFEDEYQAGMACTGLVGTKLTPEYNLQVSYAKK